jgi:hypothetical protein
MLDGGLSGYHIAKQCCRLDRNKVKRWAEGSSVPHDDERDALERFYVEWLAKRDATLRCRQQMSMQTA